jgi:hypothetical protein
MEHFVKGFIHPSNEISCVEPHAYASRMLAFVSRTVGPEEPLSQEQEADLARHRRLLSEMATPVTESSVESRRHHGRNENLVRECEGNEVEEEEETERMETRGGDGQLDEEGEDAGSGDHLEEESWTSWDTLFPSGSDVSSSDSEDSDDDDSDDTGED